MRSTAETSAASGTAAPVDEPTYVQLRLAIDGTDPDDIERDGLECPAALMSPADPQPPQVPSWPVGSYASRAGVPGDGSCARGTKANTAATTGRSCSEVGVSVCAAVAQPMPQAGGTEGPLESQSNSSSRNGWLSHGCHRRRVGATRRLDPDRCRDPSPRVARPKGVSAAQGDPPSILTTRTVPSSMRLNIVYQTSDPRSGSPHGDYSPHAAIAARVNELGRGTTQGQAPTTGLRWIRPERTRISSGVVWEVS